MSLLESLRIFAMRPAYEAMLADAVREVREASRSQGLAVEELAFHVDLSTRSAGATPRANLCGGGLDRIPPTPRGCFLLSITNGRESVARFHEVTL